MLFTQFALVALVAEPATLPVSLVCEFPESEGEVDLRLGPGKVTMFLPGTGRRSEHDMQTVRSLRVFEDETLHYELDLEALVLRRTVKDLAGDPGASDAGRCTSKEDRGEARPSAG